MIIPCNSDAHRVLMGILAEKMGEETPYHYLWLAVIGQAIADAHLSVSKSAVCVGRRLDAEQFLGGSGMDLVCRRIGLDVEWARAKVALFAVHAATERAKRLDQHRRRVRTRYTQGGPTLPLFGEAA